VPGGADSELSEDEEMIFQSLFSRASMDLALQTQSLSPTPAKAEFEYDLDYLLSLEDFDDEDDEFFSPIFGNYGFSVGGEMADAALVKDSWALSRGPRLASDETFASMRTCSEASDVGAPPPPPPPPCLRVRLRQHVEPLPRDSRVAAQPVIKADSMDDTSDFVTALRNPIPPPSLARSSYARPTPRLTPGEPSSSALRRRTAEFCPLPLRSGSTDGATLTDSADTALSLQAPPPFSAPAPAADMVHWKKKSKLRHRTAEFSPDAEPLPLLTDSSDGATLTDSAAATLSLQAPPPFLAPAATDDMAHLQRDRPVTLTAMSAAVALQGEPIAERREYRSRDLGFLGRAALGRAAVAESMVSESQSATGPAMSTETIKKKKFKKVPPDDVVVGEPWRDDADLSSMDELRDMSSSDISLWMKEREPRRGMADSAFLRLDETQSSSGVPARSVERSTRRKAEPEPIAALSGDDFAVASYFVPPTRKPARSAASEVEAQPLAGLSGTTVETGISSSLGRPVADSGAPRKDDECIRALRSPLVGFMSSADLDVGSRPSRELSGTDGDMTDGNMVADRWQFTASVLERGPPAQTAALRRISAPQPAVAGKPGRRFTSRLNQCDQSDMAGGVTELLGYKKPSLVARGPAAAARAPTGSRMAASDELSDAEISHSDAFFKYTSRESGESPVADPGVGQSGHAPIQSDSLTISFEFNIRPREVRPSPRPR